ncbi:MAG TPA: hypothetical protein PK637_14325 [Flavobacteriales bacterium]|mgnify:FL=1|nr:hypothetical protein [Flavobacteriales bacterium]HRE97942.1 hypothetical protein [Flavobacteriales bacterium]HRJ37783.1 hypothetical protein [Flavobacteriales bacterium]
MFGLTLRRFLISWLLSSGLMIMLSLLWHGVILNDLRNLPFHGSFFLVLTGLAYLAIGFLLNVLILNIEFNENHFLKRALLGGALGFFIYLIVLTLGISYHTRGFEHLVIDFSWQMIEQAVGGMIVNLCLNIYRRMDAIEGLE